MTDAPKPEQQTPRERIVAAAKTAQLFFYRMPPDAVVSPALAHDAISRILATVTAALDEMEANQRGLEEIADTHLDIVVRRQNKEREWKAERARLIEKADLALAERDAWRDAVLDRAAVLHVGGDDPRKLMDDILRMEVTIALDPAVSAEARSLVAAYRERIVAQMERQKESAIGSSMSPDQVDFARIHNHAIDACIRIAKGDGA